MYGLTASVEFYDNIIDHIKVLWKNGCIEHEYTHLLHGAFYHRMDRFNSRDKDCLGQYSKPPEELKLALNFKR